MKDLEMIKFCDFLDQQKEYRLADVIIGNLSKTAMRQNHHTENITLDKIADLTMKYSQVNPKSFTRLASVPGPSLEELIEIFRFMEKLGFKYSDFTKNIPWEEIRRRWLDYKTISKSNAGQKVFQKIFSLAVSNGGERILDPQILSRLRSMASTFQAAAGPAEAISSAVTPAAAAGAAAAAAGKAAKETADLAAKRAFISNFFSKLQNMFPKFSSQINSVKGNIPRLPVGAVYLLVSIPGFLYWGKRIIEEGLEAIDSKQEKASFGAFLSNVVASISAIATGASAVQTGGLTAALGGPIALVFTVIGTALGIYSVVAPPDEDDPTDNLPNAKKPSEGKSSAKPSSPAPKPAPKPEPTATAAPEKTKSNNPMKKIRPL